MLWTEKMFGVKKPIIAMLHIDPLPGDPLYKSENDMDKVVEHAREDLHALQDGGVDGIIFSNEFSLPYQRNMDMVTPAAMAYVIGNLRSEIKVPYGVDAISDGRACLELAAAVKAQFVRGTFCGVYVGDGGLYNNDFSSLLRRKAALPLEDLNILLTQNRIVIWIQDRWQILQNQQWQKPLRMVCVFLQMQQDRMWMMR